MRCTTHEIPTVFVDRNVCHCSWKFTTSLSLSTSSGLLNSLLFLHGKKTSTEVAAPQTWWFTKNDLENSLNCLLCVLLLFDHTSDLRYILLVATRWYMSDWDGKELLRGYGNRWLTNSRIMRLRERTKLASLIWLCGTSRADFIVSSILRGLIQFNPDQIYIAPVS